jgi:hypothetical protein
MLGSSDVEATSGNIGRSNIDMAAMKVPWFGLFLALALVAFGVPFPVIYFDLVGHHDLC